MCGALQQSTKELVDKLNFLLVIPDCLTACLLLSFLPQPFEKSGGNGDFWYSYSYGSVHWISLSSEEDMEPDSAQIAFLQQDLDRAVANRVSKACV